MFDMTIEMKGEGGLSVNQILNGYGKAFKQLGPEIIKDLAKRTQMSMVFRAPKDTGMLRLSIEATPKGSNSIEVSAGNQYTTREGHDYAADQGLGFTPHFVSAYRPEVRMWLRRHGYHANKHGLIYAKKFKPFFLETINYYLTPQLITQVSQQHIDQMKDKVRYIG